MGDSGPRPVAAASLSSVPPEATRPSRRGDRWPRLAQGCGLISSVSVLLLCAGILGEPFLLTGPFDLFLGWAIYLTETLPRVRANPSAIGMGVIALGLVAVGMHWLAGWLHAEARPEAPPLRLRVSLLLTTALVLAFVAGIGAVGVAHQVTWLATDPRPLFTSMENRGGSNAAAAIGALRTISTAQELYKKREIEQGRRGVYATLEGLGEAKLVDPVLARGHKLGYAFEVGPSVTEPGARWFAIATPLDPGPGARSFFADADGRLWFTTTGFGPIDRASCAAPDGMQEIGR